MLVLDNPHTPTTPSPPPKMSFLKSCFGSKSNLNDEISSPSNNSTDSFPTKSSRKLPSDEEILRYENELRQEEAAQGPLVSPPLPLSVLYDEFPDSNFAPKIAQLQAEHNFTEIRKCRRDGNCFYRAVAFDLIEQFKGRDPQGALQKYQSLWKEQLKASGYDSVIYEDFSEAFWSFVTCDESNTQAAWEDNEYSSNMALMLLRLLTSAQIRSNPDDYLAFIELGPQDANLQKWCERCVDAVGVDADQVQLIALAKALQIEIVVANLGSGMETDDLQISQFNYRKTDSDPSINLLYRPGHYDLLYKNQF